MGVLSTMKNLGVGRRTARRLSKDPEYANKVAAARDRNIRAVGAPFDHNWDANYRYDFPCVGLCDDGTGKKKWVSHTDTPFSDEDFNRWFDANNVFLDGSRRDLSRASEAEYRETHPRLKMEDIEQDPLSFTDHENPLVRDIARTIANGGDPDEIKKRFRKIQHVNGDGSVETKVINPDFEWNSNSETFVSREPSVKTRVANASYKDYDGSWSTESRGADAEQRKKPDSILKYVQAGGKFYNPTNLPGSVIKDYNLELGLGGWKMNSISGKKNYDATKPQIFKDGSKGANPNLERMARSYRKFTQHDPYEPVYGMPEGSDTQFMQKAKKKADEQRAAGFDEKWDEIYNERAAKVDSLAQEIKKLEEVMAKMQSEKGAAKRSMEAARRADVWGGTGADRVADLQKVYRYPDLHR